MNKRPLNGSALVVRRLFAAPALLLTLLRRADAQAARCVDLIGDSIGELVGRVKKLWRTTVYECGTAEPGFDPWRE